MERVTCERDISNNRENEVTTCSSSRASRFVTSSSRSSWSDMVETLKEENNSVLIHLTLGQIGKKRKKENPLKIFPSHRSNL